MIVGSDMDWDKGWELGGSNRVSGWGCDLGVDDCFWGREVDVQTFSTITIVLVENVLA